MGSNLRVTFIYVIWAGFLLVVASCQPTSTSITRSNVLDEETTPEQSNVASSILATASATSFIQIMTETPTLLPTETSLPANSVKPTSIPNETVTPTLWPTLSPEEANDKVLELLTNSEDPSCLLPCWWGSIPGQTEWQDVEPFLNTFATKIEQAQIGALVKLPLPEPIAVPGYGYYVSYGWDESQVIREIAVTSMNISEYDAKTMVTLYGEPDEVWLNTIADVREGVLPFQLIIVYQQKGISLRYRVNASKVGDTITACFEPNFVETERPDIFPAGPRIYLWEPDQTKTIQEISPIPLEMYYLLEDKTDLTPHLLYEKFINPDELPCIDTPAALWGSVN